MPISTFLLPGGALVAFAVAAVWFDVSERRLPNALTASAFAVALLARSLGGIPEVGAGLLAAGICFALAVPFFVAGGLGGGDVKLITAFGAFLGPERLAPALFVTALVGGGLAMAAMVRRGAVRRTLANVWWIVAGLALLGLKPFGGRRSGGSGGGITLATPGAITVPYGVAISAGALFAWFLS